LDPKVTTFSIELENDLIFLGFIAFLDPPKESAGKMCACENCLFCSLEIE
jgi:magnesium-transporting ATPase (P-type)